MQARGNRNEPENNSWVNSIWSPIRWVFQSRPSSINPRLDTRKFIAEFENSFGQNHPKFFEDSYQNAVKEAFQEGKFLLVYIHSPMHEDTNRFCRQVLCTQPVIQFMNENLLCWAGRVWDPEAFNVSMQLKATTFPFFALMVCQSGKAVQVVDRIQGYIDEHNLVERLQASVGVFGRELSRIRNETIRRQEATLLREEQDREYQQALEADRREMERRQREEEERQRAEEEARQAEELRQALELSEKLSFEFEHKRRKESLLPEPAASASDVATIRFQLPQGAKITRRFLREDKLQTVVDFLSVYLVDSGSPVKHIGIFTHSNVELGDLTITLEESKLFPRGMLYVRDMDA